MTPKDPIYTAKDYKSDLKPVWCPGCGDFGVLASITNALADMQTPLENTAFISGIGCSSRIPAYTNVYGYHTVHGRALPVGTGLKVARPDLTVIVAGGDGDGFSIGGNHFLHACRRNVDITYIVMDNSVYGMTKGQASPTTEPDWMGSKLTPEGTGVAPFRPLEIALSAGANFIARAFSGKPQDLTHMIATAVAHPGFSFIHVLSPCVTFRPEQRAYKHLTHPAFTPTHSRTAAFQTLLEDDGMGTGILYQGHAPAFQSPSHSSHTLAALKQQFVV